MASFSATLVLSAAMSMAAAACGTRSAPMEAVNADGEAAANRWGGTVGDDAPSQRFRTLDEYLAYLERTQAPVDGPWYRQIRPGVYELVSGNLRVVVPLGEEQPQQKHIFTRKELEKKFGFTK